MVNMDKIRIPPASNPPPEYAHVPHDFKLCYFLIKEVGVSAIPLSTFYTPENARVAANLVRFSVAKTKDDLDEAVRRLRGLKRYIDV